jgi:choline transporter-like protein 2/4/5
MVWTTIFFTILSVAALTGFFYYKAGLVVIAVPTSLNDKFAAATGTQLNATVAGLVSSASGLVSPSWTAQDDSQFAAYKIVAYVSTGVLVVLLCVVASMASAIRTAIEVIRIGCKALQAMPELLFMPLSNVLALGLFLVWWVFVAASLQTAGTIGTTDLSAGVRQGIALLPVQTNLTEDLGMFNTTMSTMQDLPVLQYLQLYHVFGLLWTMNFLSGVGSMTIAGAVCAWYFSQLPEGAANKPEYEKLRYGGPAVDGKPPRQRCVACASLQRTLRYYLGCIAFGSLLIAVIQAIRLAFLYLQKQMEHAGKSSILIRWLFFCIQACLKCVQSLVEAVTTNAYIFVALKGDSFCASGGRVFKLIVNHGAVFAAVNVLGTIIVFLGQVCVAVVGAAAAYVIVLRSPQFQPGGAQELTASWLPILVTLLFAYVTAGAFMGVFDLSIDSVLVCYCTDVEENMLRHEGKKEFKTSVHMASDAFDAKKRAEEKAAKAAAKAAGKGDKVAPADEGAGAGKPVAAAAAEGKGDEFDADEEEKAAEEASKKKGGKVAKGKSPKA